MDTELSSSPTLFSFVHIHVEIEKNKYPLS